MTWSRRASALSLIAAVWLGHAGCKPGTDGKGSAGDGPSDAPKLGVLFNGWFGFDHRTGECVGGLGSTHWNDSPDTAGIVHTPVAAPGEKGPFYCSADPIRINHQIDMMEDTGISVLMFSWWGWGDAKLDGTIGDHADKWMNKTLTALLEELKRRNSKIKVAVLVEPFTYTLGRVLPTALTVPQHEMILEYLQSHYYGPYREQMFQYEGHPLLSTFDPMLMPKKSIAASVRVGEGNVAIDYFPRDPAATLEIVVAAPGGPLRATAEGKNVRVELATDAAGAVRTRALDLMAYLASNAAAAPLVGATVAPKSDGTGMVAPLARRPLGAAPGGASANAEWTVKWLSSKDRSPQFEKEGWHWWLVPQQPPETTVSSDGMVFLNHRFSEYYLHMAHASYLTWQWRHINPNLEDGYYEDQWQWALDNRSRLKLVFLYSWNFYGELAQLEPSTLGPAPPGTEWLARTKRYYAQLRAGEKKLDRSPIAK